MNKITLFLVISLLVGACEPVDATIIPETTGTGGGASSTGTSASSVTSGSSGGSSSTTAGAGSGGGLSCDPCEDTDGMRIVRRRLTTTTPDGLHVVQNAAYFDTILGVGCSALLAEDNKTRCLPGLGTSVGHYGDAQCTSPVYAAPANPCYPIVLKHALRSPPPSGMCASFYNEVWAIGQPHLGSLYVKDPGGTCTSTPVPNNTAPMTLTKLPPESFAEMTSTYSPP